MPEITIPTLHPGQVSIFKNASRYNVVRCGRRWGKTKQMVTMAADAAIKGKTVGLFTPEHKQLAEPYSELEGILAPIKGRSNENNGVFKTTTGGQIDFWRLNDNALAGRGREYDMVMIDEAAFTKTPQMTSTWERSIKPTMLTKPKSKVWVFSTPNGIDNENFFWRLCNEPDRWGFREHYAPTSSNPHVPPEELEKERLVNDPRVFDQEFMALFVNWSGSAFFSEEKLLVDGAPVPLPTLCDAVYVTIDTAVKTGSDNDGTAVVFWAISAHIGHPLVILDWQIIQLEGSLLEVWLPTVYQRLEALAKECRARNGSLGAFIEDKSSGSILLQQAMRRNWPVHPINSKLTAVGKDERAISVSGYVYQGMVKIAAYAYHQTTTYKKTTRNHLLAQINGFRIGDKNAQRQDDLLDSFTYGIAIGLGNPEGY